jgi:hypothetical protein
MEIVWSTPSLVKDQTISVFFVWRLPLENSAYNTIYRIYSEIGQISIAAKSQFSNFCKWKKTSLEDDINIWKEIFVASMGNVLHSQIYLQLIKVDFFN